MAALFSLAVSGCRSVPPHPDAVAAQWAAPAAPRELDKVVLPPYRIEPPDVLSVDAINIVPRPPYRLRTLDRLYVHVENTLPEAPIIGIYQIQPGGSVPLGPAYGSVQVAGVTLEEAKQIIEQHLRDTLREPRVTVSLADIAGKQQIAGEHLVGPDGTVTLGVYGGVQVVGLTIAEAKGAIEQHLSQYLENPEVSVEVFAYNSKVYYVVTQGAGFGDAVARFPVMGNETVIDAISHVNGAHAGFLVANLGRSPRTEPGWL